MLGISIPEMPYLVPIMKITGVLPNEGRKYIYIYIQRERERERERESERAREGGGMEGAINNSTAIDNVC